MVPYCQHLYSSMYDAILCITFRTRLEKHRKKVWTGNGDENFAFCVCNENYAAPAWGLEML